MIKLNIFKNRLKRSKEGFTLVEMLVSIAIFGLISVLMTNIVISMAKFSLQNERRNDILTEIDNAANVIKNDLRGSKEIGLCKYQSKSYIYKKDSSDSFSKLDINGDKLAWVKITNTSGCSGTAVEKELTSNQNVKLKSLGVSYSTDSEVTSDTNINTLIYVYAEIYDSAPNNPIFDKDENPYSYVFAISTRKIEVI